MEYFLIWIPVGIAAFGGLFLLAYLIERKTGAHWPLNFLKEVLGWTFLVLIWVGVIPFIVAGFLFGGISFDRPSANPAGLKRAPGSER